MTQGLSLAPGGVPGGALVLAGGPRSPELWPLPQVPRPLCRLPAARLSCVIAEGGLGESQPWGRGLEGKWRHVTHFVLSPRAPFCVQQSFMKQRAWILVVASDPESPFPLREGAGAVAGGACPCGVQERP